MFTTELGLDILETEELVSGTFSQLKATITLYQANPKITKCITMIAIPNDFRYSDLDDFVGQANFRFLRYYRNIRLNCTFVIFYFDDINDSVKFYKTNNGKRFRVECNEICHLFYVENIVFVCEKELGYVDEEIIKIGIGKLLNNEKNVAYFEDEKKQIYSNSGLRFQKCGELNEDLKKLEIIDTEFMHNNDYAPNINNIISNTSEGRKLGIQLPSCPVCLQRLDQSTGGVLTIQCTHTFHCSCLFAWKDLTCPVCRSIYSNNALKCSECETFEKLWACLICGKIGCDRYTNEHAKKHAFEHNHFFAIEVGTEGVWDYVNEAYVHRLITDEGNKMVIIDEVDKIHEIRTECEILMVRQLDKQREYFENKINEIEKKYLVLIESLDHKYKELKSNYTNIENEKMMLFNDNKILERKINASDKKITELCDKFKHNKRMNDLLMKKIYKLENLNEDLKNENNDLCNHIEVQSKIMNEKGNVKIVMKKKKM